MSLVHKSCHYKHDLGNKTQITNVLAFLKKKKNTLATMLSEIEVDLQDIFSILDKRNSE